MTTFSQNPEPAVLAALAQAAPTAFGNLARQFAHLWGKSLGGHVEWERAAPPLVHFRTVVAGLYLRGFEDIPCWLLPPDLDVEHFFAPGGPGKQAGVTGTEEIPLILCPAAGIAEEARRALPRNRAVVLGPGNLAAVLDHVPEGGRHALRRIIREQIHPLSLQPFDTTRPVSGDMFFGRGHELELLRYQDGDSFLITGPSRVGKTSLMTQYHHLLRRERHPRLARSFYVNLQPCAFMDRDETARYCGMAFRSVPYTEKDLTLKGLRSFLFSMEASAGGPLELILDEADAVCGTDFLTTVGQFALETRSRLIVLGRGAVRQHWRKHSATAFGRLRDLRFHALETEEAWNLFSRPMEALGLVFQGPEVRSQMLQQTSRMPHLIQAAARAAIETAHIFNARRISASLLRRGYDPFTDFSLLRSHMDDLHSDLARLAAAEMLLRLRQEAHTAESLHAVLKDSGFCLKSSEMTEICDDLVINCLLGWEENGYAEPRWDIRQTAQRHPRHLQTIKAECLARLQTRTEK